MEENYLTEAAPSPHNHQQDVLGHVSNALETVDADAWAAAAAAAQAIPYATEVPPEAQHAPAHTRRFPWIVIVHEPAAYRAVSTVPLGLIYRVWCGFMPAGIKVAIASSHRIP